MQKKCWVCKKPLNPKTIDYGGSASRPTPANRHRPLYYWENWRGYERAHCSLECVQKTRAKKQAAVQPRPDPREVLPAVK